MQVTEHIEMAADWLTRSGIVHRGAGQSGYGPLKGGYFLDEKRYDCIYHEINGYGMSCLVDLYRQTGDHGYLEHAQVIASYLLSNLGGDDGEASSIAFSHSMVLPGMQPVNKFYAFDNGMIVAGLIDLHEATGDNTYLNAAVRCMSWVVDCLQTDDGAFYSYYDGDTGTLWHGGSHFDCDRSVLHAKLAIPLLKTAKHSAHSVFRKSAEALLNWAVELQADDGAFWSNEHRKAVFTHAHCYAVEGFLYAFFATRHHSYLDTANCGIRWLSTVQHTDGALNYQYKNRISVLDALRDRLVRRKTTDATAQAIRLWLLAGALSRSDHYRSNAERAIEFLGRMQCEPHDRDEMAGGMLYRLRDSVLWKHPEPVLYSWCTQFAVQAFMMWRDSGSSVLDKESIGRLF
jgi:uncharacterized protein YyaL (SSP411 family)